jgi:predicted AlkP superfamily phosphohydrolase/phosphomutase
LLDTEVGAFLDELGPDVSVLVVSDHGSQAMAGCFCINEWLRQEGYLNLEGPAPPPGTPLEKSQVDWSRTRVWGAGGYYARLSFNLRGREPKGTVDPQDLPGLTEELRRGLSALRTPAGTPLPVRLFRPQDVYTETRGDPPDLMAYFDEARWRSAGTLGHGRLYLEENDTGPDDAVHSFDGVIAFREAGSSAARELGTQQIRDVAPTILARFGVESPSYVQGRPIRGLVAR